MGQICIQFRTPMNFSYGHSKEKVYIINLRSNDKELNEAILSGIDNNFEIMSSLIFNNKLYVLTKKSILIFTPI